MSAISLTPRQGGSMTLISPSIRRGELTEELSFARADYEAYTVTESTLDITQHNGLSLRLSSLENVLASTSHDIH